MGDSENVFRRLTSNHGEMKGTYTLPSSFQAASEQQDLANGDVSRTTGLRRALCIPRLSFRRVVDVACAPYNHIIKISNVPSTLLWLGLHVRSEFYEDLYNIRLWVDLVEVPIHRPTGFPTGRAKRARLESSREIMLL
ncbi:hypothetical protein HZH66_003778 [Vespula vulgaris]|uniref:Uncharacterized protein n=1 Tax=Vespula vulgaris TaxID=7454 RepID=A0A834KDX0_VESVU|nr:hypothetical protein HZH66_003778 [Vespula vulgaris]